MFITKKHENKIKLHAGGNVSHVLDFVCFIYKFTWIFMKPPKFIDDIIKDYLQKRHNSYYRLKELRVLIVTILKAYDERQNKANT